MVSERAHRAFVWSKGRESRSCLDSRLVASITELCFYFPTSLLNIAGNLASHIHLPNTDQIQEDTARHFGVRPCISQVNAALAQMQRDTDVVYISRTGSGKTLTFWIPMLYEMDSITILITALNVLGEQTAEILAKAGIPAINLTRENANNSSFQDIKSLKYRLIVVNPELLVQDPRFDKLWTTSQFTSRLARFIFDEGHCVSQWGASFRPEFANLYKLRFLIPKTITFYLVSATLPKCVLDDIRDKLHLKSDTRIIRRSNDRWNCHLIVRRMQYGIASFQDLNFLFRNHTSDQNSSEKFLIFFNNRKEAEEAAEYIWKTFGRKLKNNIVWFHSIMSDQFRKTTLKSFKESRMESGSIWALTCTDAAGMGLDISDITIIVQWRLPDSLCTLMQRFGRAARDLNLTGTCILLVEPRYFTDKKEARESQVAEEQATSMRTQIQQTESSRPTKKARTIKPTEKPPIGIAIEASMDQFVNAEREIPACRRAVSNKYFNNNNLTPEESCCTRCQNRTPMLCCDLCEPSLLEIFDTSNMVIPSPFHESEADELVTEDAPTSSGSKVRKNHTKPYTLSSQDLLLHKELYKWRDEIYGTLGKAFDEYGFGSSIIMTDNVIQRLIDLAHYEKVKKIEDLTTQTTWCDDFGMAAEVLGIIKRIHPPITPINLASIFTQTPRVYSSISAPTLSPNSPLGSLAQSSLQRKSIKCSVCGQSGHNARNPNCPKKLSIPAIRSFGLDIINQTH